MANRVAIWTLFAVSSLACTTTTELPNGPPTPAEKVARIDEVTPKEGAYGTTVTVRGANLSGSVRAKDPDGQEITLSRGGGGAALTFRFTFPADGEMELDTESGKLALGSFTPRWSPGRSASFDATETVHASAALGDETVLLVSGTRGVGFYVFGAGESRFVPMQGVTSLASVAMRAAGSGVEALVAEAGSLRLVTFDGQTVGVTPYTMPVDPVIGVGDDGAGFVVVTLGPSGIERHRGAPPDLVASGTPVPMPTNGTQHEVHAVSGNGTVIYAWDSVGGNPLDEEARFSMRGLAPTENAFGAQVTMASLDDDAKSLSVSVSDGVVRLDYCAIDQDALDPKLRDRCGTTYTHDGASRLDLLGSNVETDAKLHVSAGKLVYARCDGEKSELRFGASKDTEEVAVWPCPSVVAVTPSATGPRVVVVQDGKLYAVKKR